MKQQKINTSLWQAFEKEKKEKKPQEIKIRNSGKQSEGEWTRKIIENVKLSEIAREYGIKTCPKCGYDLIFNDSRGWFCCEKTRWSKKTKCDFAGNIVEFFKFLEELK